MARETEKVYPVLYSFRRCPYAMRARLAIQISGMRCELREVVLRNKPEQFIAVSPKATVPVVIDNDGRVMEESLDIMHWALSRHDPEHWLPTLERERVATDALIDQCDGEFKYHLDRYKYTDRYPGETRDTHKSLASQFVNNLNRCLQQHLYLVGDRFTLADAAIAPFIRQFANTDKDWFDAQPWSAVQQWLSTIVGSSRFLAIMHKYPAWTPDKGQTLFPGID